MEQAGSENKSLRRCGLFACAVLLVPGLLACEAINESGGALPPAPETVSQPVAPRATPAAQATEASEPEAVPAAPYQTGQHDTAYSTYWQEAQRQGLVVTEERPESPSEFTQSYLNPDYSETAVPRPGSRSGPVPRPVPAAVMEETTSIVDSASSGATSRYVTADGLPYPELDTDGLPVEEVDARATTGTTSVISRGTGEGGYGVHLASYRVAANAQRGWQILSTRHEVLMGREARIAAVDLPEKGPFLRLKAGPFASRAGAVEACRMIKAMGDYCAVTTFDGVAF